MAVMAAGQGDGEGWSSLTLYPAISFGISCLTLSRIRTDLRPHPREGAPTRPLQHVKEGYRFVWHQPFFRTMLVWSGINNLLVNACFIVVDLRLIRDHYAHRPGVAWAREMYRRHRGTSAAVEG